MRGPRGAHCSGLKPGEEEVSSCRRCSVLSCRCSAAVGAAQLPVLRSCRWCSAAGAPQLSVLLSCRCSAAVGTAHLPVLLSCRADSKLAFMTGLDSGRDRVHPGILVLNLLAHQSSGSVGSKSFWASGAESVVISTDPDPLLSTSKKIYKLFCNF